MPGKRVQFDDETWHALDQLAKDRMQDFQELADEAFGDLLRKHGWPTDLKTALRQSVAGMEERPRSFIDRFSPLFGDLHPGDRPLSAPGVGDSPLHLCKPVEHQHG